MTGNESAETTETQSPEVPPGVDLEKPSAARIYDWYLGGTHNWAVDREFGRKALEAWPHAAPGSRHNRQFMNRVVRAALDAGTRQFIDLGSGIPTVGNVHEVVRDHLPENERANVVYVDNEGVAAAHARLILEREDATDWATLIQHDMRDPAGILTNAETSRLIDFTQPVCLLMMAVLHFVGPDDRPREVLDAYLDRLSSGSWLAISHLTVPDDPELAEGVLGFAARYRDTSNPVTLRSREEFESFFDGLELLAPGVTYQNDWRPDPDAPRLRASDKAASHFAWCAVAEKP